MPPNKKILLESRLQKRLKSTNSLSFKHYIDDVSHPRTIVRTYPHGGRRDHNKTDFFRCPDHFEFLASTVVPGLQSKKISSLKLWSVGCSSGEEPYTLAMALSEYNSNQASLNFFYPGHGPVFRCFTAGRTRRRQGNGTVSGEITNPCPVGKVEVESELITGTTFHVYFKST